MEEVQTQLSAFRLVQQNEEQKLRTQWQMRERVLWERIEGVIKIEEAKVRDKLEVERRKKEEEDRIRQEAISKQRHEEERRRQEAERIKKAAEERQRAEDVKQKMAEQLAAEENERKSLGVTTAEQDWHRARSTLQVRAPKGFRWQLCGKSEITI